MVNYNFNKLYIFIFFIFTVIGCDKQCDLDDLGGRECYKELLIKNFAGNYQNIHPKVLYFEQGFNNYKFWMVYTPYPYGDTRYENVCITVSNDGIIWENIKDVTNPIVPQYCNGYNSDPHLVYNEDKNHLEIWYRPYSTALLKSRIVRTTSLDGISWSEEQVIFDFDDNQKLSPVVIYEDNRYKLWICNQGVIQYTESSSDNPFSWLPYRTLSINNKDLHLWHMDIINTASIGYEYFICAYEPGETNNSANLYYTVENDNVFSDLQVIIDKGNEYEYKIERSIYRTSVCHVNDKYYIYCSSISENWKRHMMLIACDDILNIPFNPLN